MGVLPPRVTRGPRPLPSCGSTTTGGIRVRCVRLAAGEVRARPGSPACSSSTPRPPTALSRRVRCPPPAAGGRRAGRGGSFETSDGAGGSPRRAGPRQSTGSAATGAGDGGLGTAWAPEACPRGPKTAPCLCSCVAPRSHRSHRC